LTTNAKVYEYYKYTNPKTGNQEIAVTKDVVPKNVMAKKETEVAEDILDVVILIQKEATKYEDKEIIAKELIPAIQDNELIIASSVLIPIFIDDQVREQNKTVKALISGN